MKKIVLLFMCVLTVSITALAQAYEGSIQYNKKKEQAIAIDYSYPPEAVQNAIVQKLGKIGYKPKEEKGFLNSDRGFLIFKNVYVTDISRDRMDYIIKVERKSRKASDESTLYLIMNKDGGNAIEKMEASDIGNAKLFLNNMLPDIEAAELELRIKDQEATVAKAEKKLKNLQEEKINLENKLTANIKSQDDAIKDIDDRKQTLEILKGKRSKN